MRVLALGEPPARLQVLRQVFRLFDRRNDGLVDILLIGRLGCGERLLLLGLSLREELGFRRFGALGSGFREVRVVDLLIDL